jgi:hypothetical protein
MIKTPPVDGTAGGVFCGEPHPDYTEPQTVTAEVEQLGDNGDPVTRPVKITVDAPYVFCRRIGRHDGDHAAYTFSIREPERWPNYSNNRSGADDPNDSVISPHPCAVAMVNTTHVIKGIGHAKIN